MAKQWFLAAVVGALAQTGSAQAGWGAWQPMGLNGTEEVTIFHTEIDKQPALVLTAMGQNNAMWYRVRLGASGWSKWVDGGGYIRSEPACVERNPVVTDCFVVTKDQRIAQNSMVKGGWTGWATPFEMGQKQSYSSNLEAVSPGRGRITTMVMNYTMMFGLHGAVWNEYTGWGPYSPIPSPGWTNGLGAFGCDQKTIKPGSTDADPQRYLTACVAESVNEGKFNLHLFGYQNAVVPLNELAISMRPDVRIDKGAEGYEVIITYRSALTKAGARSVYVLGKGIRKNQTGANAEVLGGRLNTGIMCTKDGRACAARGLDDQVYVIEQN